MKPSSNKPRKAIDWKEVRQRLARAMAATDAALALSPQRAREIMEERARVLARVPPRAALAAETLEVVTFSLANERYAIETHHVRGVVRLADYTLVPGAPDFLVGIINLRGEIVAVLDLRRILAVSLRGLTDLSRVLVLGGERSEFGIQADAVHEVRTLRIDEVLEPPGSIVGRGREYVRGVTRDALVVLNGGVLMQDRRLFIDQEEEQVQEGRGPGVHASPPSRATRGEKP